jgi:hypothetical protein
MGQHWVKGNGGQDLEQSPNASARQAGHVEDKQWIAVNDIAGSPGQDHVYAMWPVFNNSTTKIRIAVSRDRGTGLLQGGDHHRTQSDRPVEHVHLSVD